MYPFRCSTLSIAGTLLFTLAIVPFSDADTATPTEAVQTTNGPVQGFEAEGIQTFKGIRYGAPPTGELRFMPPQRPEPWNVVVSTVDYGPSAIQMATGATANPTTELSKQLATVFTTSVEMKTNQEDCLFLNVWTPELDDKKRPVMVWLHGGGYAYGSGSWPVYDGHNLAEKGDVVVVTVNHRLNAFGYLHLAEIGGEKYAKSGNAGMLDLVLMLEWVRDNIAAFGGDPGNVTIFGESGGGAKVSTLMAMPAAVGLFHKAIIESGPGLTGVPVQQATANAQSILDELGITAETLDRIHEISADDILQAAFAAAEKAGDGGRGPSRLAPVVDGDVLPRDPFTPDAPEISKNVPVIVGLNKDEWSIFIASEPWFGRITEEMLLARAEEMAGDKAEPLLAAFRKLHPDYSPTYLLNDFITNMRMFIGSVTLAERKAAQNAAPVYMYYLTWETPVGGGIFKCPHTLEIPFVFNNVDKARPLVGPGEEPEILSDQMSDAWIAFARTGNPNADSIPAWPAYDAETRATMVFDLESEVVNDPLSEVREILQDS